MSDGLIVKALSGFYYVQPDGSTADVEPIQCRARGIFKKNKVTPLVGDRVRFVVSDTGEGTVDDVLPRTSELIRPPVANVDQAVLVFSVVEPSLHLQLLDKFLVHVEHAGLETIICLTKHDLLNEADEAKGTGLEAVAQAVRLYEQIGYSVYVTSSLQSIGIPPVKARLQGRISVVAGQSGVGKSSLLNAVLPKLSLETNAISQRLGRGKHTTRHVELLALPDGGWVADTPGFSQLDFLQIEAEELSGCFREFREPSEDCRFRGCLHHQEPDCRVRAAVEKGLVAESRFAHYTQFLQEIRDRKRRY